VSYQDGDIEADKLQDVEVLGNVTYNHGRGKSDTVIDGYGLALPTIVRGNLTFIGSGRTIVRHGGSSLASVYGFIVGGNFRVNGGADADQLYLLRAEVGGKTVLSLGEGNNFISIDDSVFHGSVTITTGSGSDAVYIEALAGTGARTVFEKAVSIRQGAGDDYFHFPGLDDLNEWMVVFSEFVVHHGSGADVTAGDPYQIDNPLNRLLAWVR
jgi:hypothetical protein